MVELTEKSKAILAKAGVLPFEEWNRKIKGRGIEHKFDHQLEQVKAMYRQKLPRLEAILAQAKADSEEALILKAKIARIEDKYACILKEQEFREKNLVTRELHGTTYYIDLTSGSDANNGTATGTPWLTIQQYTSVTLRSAGDIAWVRANTSQTVGAVNIDCDEDGTVNSYIEIRGCSATAGEDPWSDSSTVKPVINFNGGSYGFYINGDHYWRLYRLDIKDSHLSTGMMNMAGASIDTIFDSCVFHEAIQNAIRVSANCTMKFISCSFYDNTQRSVYAAAANLIFDGCSFNGGAATTDYGIVIDGFTNCVCIDCTFGVTTAHDLSSFWLGTGAQVTARNCLLSDATELTTNVALAGWYFRSEDHDQVKGAVASQYPAGNIDRDSSVQLDSLDSAKMSPSATCGAQQPLTLFGDLFDTAEFSNDYSVWCPASATTITIKARETAAWAADPSATEFYFEASYLSAASGGARATQASAQGLSGVTEVSFTMTFTPAQAGWVYVTCYLKDYEASKYINVSVKPVVS